MAKRVLIIGGGFGGLEAAKALGRDARVDVTLIDRRNHHLFQPLLYQVSMAGLSPADISSPIRSILHDYRNVRVVLGEALSADLARRELMTDFGVVTYDYLVVATGANHSYFGQDAWEEFAPGLKSIEQATEIRRRVFQAFELAERESAQERQRQLLTFVVIGGGPTGVELAGALGEITRFTLAKDFRSIDPSSARIVLMEAGDRLLPAFDPQLSQRAKRDLEALGVQVWLGGRVTGIDASGVRVGDEFLSSTCVLWAAGVKASALAGRLGLATDKLGRIIVNAELNPAEYRDVFAIGDCAAVPWRDGFLPGLAPAAIQQGRHIARQIAAELDGKPRQAFRYIDKGMMATIGRTKAVLQFGPVRMAGLMAWVAWLGVHIWYLVGFRNKVMVYLQWIWSFVRYRRGARLIIDKSWKLRP